MAEEAGTIIDMTPDEEVSMALRDDAMDPADMTASMRILERAGYIVPVATPQQLREASALKQRIYAAILDERDYLYTVSYQTSNQGKESTRQWLTMSRTEAIERGQALNGIVGAKPKKSGIVKLARALGIVCTPVLREERTIRGVTGYYIVYEATHAGTGLKEEGVGWCDPSERRGGMSIHDMIATADTRAYNRAVLRLSGFGDVSADEIIAGASLSDEPLPAFVPETGTPSTLKALPVPNDDNVLTASRIWAEKIAAREGDRFAAEAQQDTLAARELRARARRGEEAAAQKLGVLGLTWNGSAQDGRGQPVFDVEAPPVKPEEIKLATDAATKPAEDKPNGKPQGWDLSPPGETEDDEAPAPEPAPEPEQATTGGLPPPHPNAETIVTGQAKKVSLLLLDIFDGDRSKCQEWLKTHARVDGSVHLRANQYDAVMSALSTMQKKKKEA